MSALPSKAGMCRALVDVRFGPIADIISNIQWTKVPYTDQFNGVMFCVKQAACAKEEIQMGILDELLGGGQRQKEYRDFVARYEQGDPSEGYSDREVLQRYGDVSHAVPPNQYAQAAIEALGKLSPEDRAAFLKMLQERAATLGVALPRQVTPEPKELGQVLTDLHGKPGQLRDMLGGDAAQPQQQASASPITDILSSPMAKAVLAGIAAMVVKRVMQGSSRTT